MSKESEGRRGIHLISDALPFGRLWYDEPNAASNAVSYAKFRSRSHDAVIRVYDQAEKVIDTIGAIEESVLRMTDTGSALFNRFCVRLSIGPLINEWLAVRVFGRSLLPSRLGSQKPERQIAHQSWVRRAEFARGCVFPLFDHRGCNDSDGVTGL